MIALWIGTGILAAAYLLAGGTKLLRPKTEVQKTMHFAEDFAASQIKTIGALEVLGAIGLILPELTHIATWLTPTAAFALVLVQIGAIVVHLRRGEKNVVVNIVLLLLALAIGIFWIVAG
ncbi:MAG TPA: DoxX family protein [Microbacteriaceae bacterium]